MSINPIDENSTPKTTGSLEDLFRHHLGEEAAVPPSPMLWDQIDNSLLIRQNEIYRRRLTATRWVAAASLLLATLAGTGWWAGHDARLGGSNVAATGQPTASGLNTTAPTGATGATTARNSGSLAGTMGGSWQPAAASGAVAPSAAQGGNGTGASASSGRASSSAQLAVAANSAPRYTGFGSAEGQPSFRNSAAGSRTQQAHATQAVAASNSASLATYAANTTAANPAEATTALTNADRSAADRALTAGVTADVALAQAGTTAAGSGAAAGTTAVTPTLALATPVAATAAPEEMGLLAARSAALNLSDAAALPNGLATITPVEVPAIETDAHRWHYGASYTAGVFNPNINFSRAGIEPEHDYNPALGAESPALTEAAAAQYRENLRSGLTQRIALLASRHLNGHWSLRTGAEFSQSTAKSASAASFVGEQIPYVGQSTNGPLHTTDFRYRMASIPVELRYDNPVKRGWSLYGRLGCVVSALLGVRSEVEGDPEATKTYSLMSASTPYRRVLGNLRGGAGAQFRSSTGSWALTLGPVAEVGLVSLNAHPVQSYLAQSRAYSFGLEAGVEFGR